MQANSARKDVDVVDERELADHDHVFVFACRLPFGVGRFFVLRSSFFAFSSSFVAAVILGALAPWRRNI